VVTGFQCSNTPVSSAVEISIFRWCAPHYLSSAIRAVEI
jgi:hypothetical protein